MVMQYLTQQNNNMEKALALHRSGQINEAKIIYQKVLKNNPKNFDAINLLCEIEIRKGEYELAIELLEKAILIQPTIAELHINCANLYAMRGMFDNSINKYKSAIKINPNLFEAHYNLGNILHEMKIFDQSLISFNHAVNLAPNSAPAYSNRGLVLKELKRTDEALENFIKAIELSPHNSEPYINCGNLLRENKMWEAALKNYDEALKINSDNATAYANRAIVYFDLNLFDNALDDVNKAIKINPNYCEAFIILGNIHKELRAFNEAHKNYSKALSINPEYEYLYGMYLNAKMQISDWSNINNEIQFMQDKISQEKKVAHAFHVLAMIDSLKIQKINSSTYNKDKFNFFTNASQTKKEQRNKKIKIGYFSPDFRNHPMSQWVAELFELHSKNKFEIIGFYFGPKTKDHYHDRIVNSFDTYIDVQDKSDQYIAQLARDMNIDIAIDLAGLTALSRTAIFANRAAPLQINYIGYPATMGANFIDYIIADEIVIPKSSQEQYTEKIIYLPTTYKITDTKIKIASKKYTKEEIGLPNNGFIFCNFNNNYKITQDIFNGWLRILKAVHGSVLWLLEDNESSVNNLKQLATKIGIDQNRIIFAPKMELSEHLSRISVADLFLDTFPYTAHTTATDALWAGLPVLTRVGESFVSRVAASILSAIEMQELITYSQEEYETKAIELAKDIRKITELKNKLEKNKFSTTLFNTQKITNNIETAYEEIYERYHSDLLPDHIYINDF